MVAGRQPEEAAGASRSQPKTEQHRGEEGRASGRVRRWFLANGRAMASQREREESMLGAWSTGRGKTERLRKWVGYIFILFLVNF